jgi:hypothetical protein
MKSGVANDRFALVALRCAAKEVPQVRIASLAVLTIEFMTVRNFTAASDRWLSQQSSGLVSEVSDIPAARSLGDLRKRRNLAHTRGCDSPA